MMTKLQEEKNKINFNMKVIEFYELINKNLGNTSMLCSLE